MPRYPVGLHNHDPRRALPRRPRDRPEADAEGHGFPSLPGFENHRELGSARLRRPAPADGRRPLRTGAGSTDSWLSEQGRFNLRKSTNMCAIPRIDKTQPCVFKVLGVPRGD